MSSVPVVAELSNASKNILPLPSATGLPTAKVIQTLGSVCADGIGNTAVKHKLVTRLVHEWIWFHDL